MLRQTIALVLVFGIFLSTAPVQAGPVAFGAIDSYVPLATQIRVPYFNLLREMRWNYPEFLSQLIRRDIDSLLVHAKPSQVSDTRTFLKKIGLYSHLGLQGHFLTKLPTLVRAHLLVSLPVQPFVEVGFPRAAKYPKIVQRKDLDKWLRTLRAEEERWGSKNSYYNDLVKDIPAIEKGSIDDLTGAEYALLQERFMNRSLSSPFHKLVWYQRDYPDPGTIKDDLRRYDPANPKRLEYVANLIEWFLIQLKMEGAPGEKPVEQISSKTAERILTDLEIFNAVLNRGPFSAVLANKAALAFFNSRPNGYDPTEFGDFDSTRFSAMRELARENLEELIQVMKKIEIY